MPSVLNIASPGAINPLQCPDWDLLLAARPGSCFFHGAAWARVLHETYGHRPFYFCEIAEQHLQSLLPVMEVSSPLTGRRGVALPFSDFCPALGENRFVDEELVAAAMEQGRKNQWRYLEFRDARPRWPDCVPSMEFHSHVIDLEPGREELFNRFDDSVRRGIRKAEKAGLQMEFSNTSEAMEKFYALHSLTRRRHGLPPQPFRFFKNMVSHILQKGQGFIATALSKARPVAASVFFHDGRQAIYKFGASDFAFQHLRPNNFMMWNAIRHCLDLGMVELHLGRTSLLNGGLRRFKLGFGSREETIFCFKYDFRKQTFVGDIDRTKSWVNYFFGSLPLPLLRLSGRLLYPHLS